MEAKRICPYCMGELESRVSVCPHCGGVLAGRNPAGSLPVGTLLQGKVLTNQVLAQPAGQPAFGLAEQHDAEHQADQGQVGPNQHAQPDQHRDRPGLPGAW